jgi:hypothetical protein
LFVALYCFQCQDLVVPRSSEFSPGTAANIGAAIAPVDEAESFSTSSLLPGGRVDKGVGPSPKPLTSISDVNLIETQLQLDVDSKVCIFFHSFYSFCKHQSWQV